MADQEKKKVFMAKDAGDDAKERVFKKKSVKDKPEDPTAGPEKMKAKSKEVKEKPQNAAQDVQKSTPKSASSKKAAPNLDTLTKSPKPTEVAAAPAPVQETVDKSSKEKKLHMKASKPEAEDVKAKGEDVVKSTQQKDDDVQNAAKVKKPDVKAPKQEKLTNGDIPHDKEEEKPAPKPKKFPKKVAKAGEESTEKTSEKVEHVKLANPEKPDEPSTNGSVHDEEGTEECGEEEEGDDIEQTEGSEGEDEEEVEEDEEEGHEDEDQDVEIGDNDNEEEVDAKEQDDEKEEEEDEENEAHALPEDTHILEDAPEMPTKPPEEVQKIAPQAIDEEQRKHGSTVGRHEATSTTSGAVSAPKKPKKFPAAEPKPADDEENEENDEDEDQDFAIPKESLPVDTDIIEDVPEMPTELPEEVQKTSPHAIDEAQRKTGTTSGKLTSTASDATSAVKRAKKFPAAKKKSAHEASNEEEGGENEVEALQQAASGDMDASKIKSTAAGATDKADDVASGAADKVKGSASDTGKKAQETAGGLEEAAPTAKKFPSAKKPSAPLKNEEEEDGNAEALGQAAPVDTDVLQNAPDMPSSLPEDVNKNAPHALGAIQQKNTGAQKTASSVTGKAKDTAKDAVGKAQDTAKYTASKAQNAAKSTAGKAQHTAKVATDRASGAASKAPDTAKSGASQAQNLSTSAIAEALGVSEDMVKQFQDFQAQQQCKELPNKREQALPKWNYHKSIMRPTSRGDAAQGEKVKEEQETGVAEEEPGDFDPSDLYLDVTSTREGIQLIVRIPTVYGRKMAQC
ncbi:hypothetical protein POJ06DRAFT_18727 [Lipomyces tetrasporus]|uniref:Uncharacterized protein n=1 Tax=Lipomyces tetrasporus TaxID=54092 RepID=A0AAD7QZJ8_9ASCO|nr:uncharacterized protein POJ06DRAFT_18727 [Lipomyces tetrasporus]KAJ8104382.1 hypothetical protein POJ06DRAFT_18727 [Lipomyces tetrasporus]